MTKFKLSAKQYGFLKFDYPKKSNDYLSQFIQLLGAPRDESIVQFMSEAYQLPLPHLIVSIQTDHMNTENHIDNNFVISEEIKRTIQRGLAETAKITDAWIMTNGINHAMNRLVGEGLHDNVSESDVPCFGFCSYPYSKDRIQLQKMPVEIRHSTRDNDDAHDPEIGCIGKYNRISSTTHLTSFELQKQSCIYSYKCNHVNDSYNLEPNHTHFVLFERTHNDCEYDQREQNECDEVIRTRHEIEYGLTNLLSTKVVGYDQWNEFDEWIPLVVLLLGGNLMTPRQLCFYLDKDIPVVVVRGTGGIADIVADIIASAAKFSTSNGGKLKFNVDDWKRDRWAEVSVFRLRLARMKSLKEFHETNPHDDIERDITALAHNNQLIVVFDPAGANGNLKDAIAAAILKRIYFRREKNASSKYKSLAMELKWCLVWDKVDHARQNVFATHIFENISTSHTIQEFVSSNRN
ncbi:unnamed protein product [Rotaria magnacalcarata]